MKPIYSILFLLAFVAASAQIRTVSGVVTDETGEGLPGVNVVEKGTTRGVTTDLDGEFSIQVSGQNAVLVFSSIGMATQEIVVGQRSTIDVGMSADTAELQEVVVTGYGSNIIRKLSGAVAGVRIGGNRRKNRKKVQSPVANVPNESYAGIEENGFKNPMNSPLSTFSADVDVASYANLRRFITGGALPPADAVRVEEMINYFKYDYKQPEGEDPFSINTELMPAPWNDEHLIVQVGLKGRDIDLQELPPSNIVLLIDVSGSMNESNKLPLLKTSLKMLVRNLRDKDRISIVTYANHTRTHLITKRGSKKEEIIASIDELYAGGGTAGNDGLLRAYKIAEKNFLKNGNNRVILATDGDFNIGPSSDREMKKLIEEKKKTGVFLTVLGFGMGNYKDSKMETLANKGNGNYAYIDDLFEAKKVLVDELGANLFTIAKDVKIQVEFNPAKVQAYRLIGYENRLLQDEDFDDDEKDAGEIGCGHTVTALYEIIPVGVKSKHSKDIRKLKYQRLTDAESNSDELMTVHFRYKEPKESESKLITDVIVREDLSAGDNVRWACAVAGFGMMLRKSDYIGKLKTEDILELAEASRGIDKEGYRSQFIQLVELTQSMSL